MINQEIVSSIENFRWESKEQKEGYLALLKYTRDHNQDPRQVSAVFAFFIQKSLDSHNYWVETMAQQVQTLENEIRALQETVEKLQAK